MTVTLVFPIRYRFDGNIFNLRRLQAKIKVQIDVLDERLFIFEKVGLVCSILGFKLIFT